MDPIGSTNFPLKMGEKDQNWVKIANFRFKISNWKVNKIMERRNWGSIRLIQLQNGGQKKLSITVLLNTHKIILFGGCVFTYRHQSVFVELEGFAGGLLRSFFADASK
jgi:hypothetical protein